MHITFSHHKLLVYIKLGSEYHDDLQKQLQNIHYTDDNKSWKIDANIDPQHKIRILTWLYHRYVEDVPITLEHFKSMLFSYELKPIEVRFVNSVSDAKTESLEIKVTVWGLNTLILKPSFAYERLYKYLKLLFENVIRNDEKEYFELILTCSSEIEVFERFMTRQLLIKQHIHFTYNPEALDSFFYTIEEEEERANELQASYMLLDMDDDASFEEIKSSYRELAKSCHPDLSPIENSDEISEKTIKFQDLQSAYETIKSSILV
jgi:hypothetical protein